MALTTKSMTKKKEEPIVEKEAAFVPEVDVAKKEKKFVRFMAPDGRFGWKEE